MLSKIKTIKTWSRQKRLLLTLVAIGLLVPAAPVWAVTYGSGKYGASTYNSSTANSPATVSSTPTTGITSSGTGSSSSSTTGGSAGSKQSTTPPSSSNSTTSPTTPQTQGHSGTSSPNPTVTAQAAGSRHFSLIELLVGSVLLLAGIIWFIALRIKRHHEIQQWQEYQLRDHNNHIVPPTVPHSPLQ